MTSQPGCKYTTGTWDITLLSAVYGPRQIHGIPCVNKPSRICSSSVFLSNEYNAIKVIPPEIDMNICACQDI